METLLRMSEGRAFQMVEATTAKLREPKHYSLWLLWQMWTYFNNPFTADLYLIIASLIAWFTVSVYVKNNVTKHKLSPTKYTLYRMALLQPEPFWNETFMRKKKTSETYLENCTQKFVYYWTDGYVRLPSRSYPKLSENVYIWHFYHWLIINFFF